MCSEYRERRRRTLEVASKALETVLHMNGADAVRSAMRSHKLGMAASVGFDDEAVANQKAEELAGFIREQGYALGCTVVHRNSWSTTVVAIKWLISEERSKATHRLHWSGTNLHAADLPPSRHRAAGITVLLRAGDDHSRLAAGRYIPGGLSRTCRPCDQSPGGGSDTNRPDVSNVCAPVLRSIAVAAPRTLLPPSFSSTSAVPF